MVLDQGFHIDIFSDDEMARNALAGAPFTIIPFGTIRRGGEVRVVDSDVADEFVANWQQRATRGIRRTHLAVDVDHEGGAVGWYSDVLRSPHGVDACFKWNAAGRKLLEGGAYAYFSPSLYWSLKDRVSGEMVHNQIAGGALTNYPYFGNDTALYRGPAPIWYIVTKNEGGDEYPARAYLIAENPEKQSTWQMRVYSWQDGELRPCHGLMGTAKATLEEGRYRGPRSAEALRALKKLYDQENVDFKSHGGVNMTENEKPNDVVAGLKGLAWLASFFKGAEMSHEPHAQAIQAPLVAPSEDFAALQTRLDILETKRKAEMEQHAEQITALREALGQEQDQGAVTRFAALAQQFSHLPGDLDALATQLRWLHEADAEDGSPHVAFFTNLLRKADAQFAVHFSELNLQQGQDATAATRIEEAVAKHRVAHPEASYSDALSDVLAMYPALYQAYDSERAVRVRAAGGV